MFKPSPVAKAARTDASRGFSLIEMLLTVLLGSLIVLAVASVFISGRRTMATSEALSRTQEASRVAFEMMSRDVREAGSNPCSSSLKYGNVLTSRNTAWWTAFNNGLNGYTGSQATLGTPTGIAFGNRIAGTQAFDVHATTAGEAGETAVVSKMLQPSAELSVRASTVFQAGDLALVCDTVAGYIFQITGLAGGNTQLQHVAGGTAPGNCAGDFSSEFASCTGAGTGYLFGADAAVAKVTSARWYIGSDGAGGRSLFRSELVNRGATATPTSVVPVEMAKGVTTMEVGYLVTGGTSFVDASSVTDWRQVRALRVRFALQSEVQGSRDAVARTSTQVIALRNRTQ